MIHRHHLHRDQYQLKFPRNRLVLVHSSHHELSHQHLLRSYPDHSGPRSYQHPHRHHPHHHHPHHRHPHHHHPHHHQDPSIQLIRFHLHLHVLLTFSTSIPSPMKHVP